MSKIFSQSANINKEYTCSIVKIGEVTPVEGSDFLSKTEIRPNTPIVVRRDEVKEGDIMFYVDLESQLNDRFLAVNNMYSDAKLNDNYEEIQKVAAQMQTEGATPDQIQKYIESNKGYFGSNGRVRMKRMRGQESLGFLFSQATMTKFCPAVAELDLSTLVGEEFDTVDGKLFVQSYVPIKKAERTGGLHEGKRNRKIKRFDRMIPGQFSFHYDTDLLEKNLNRIHPEDVVTLSVKLHGTSAIFGNVRVKRQLSVWEKIKKFFGADVPLTEWGNIYSSRSVIKNQYINEGVTDGFYGTDLWGVWNGLIGKYIPRGWTIYGEIVGFVGPGSYVQKDFDYGCRNGESKLMIYRISQETEDGHKYEWNVTDVHDWTMELIHDLEAIGENKLAGMIHPIDIVYHGTLRDLYPEIAEDENWAANVVRALANEKKFYMEEEEPLCRNHVPREGLVLRKDNDPVKEAFKLKTMKFRNKEAKAIDSGEADIEMQERYGNEE